MSDLTEKRIHRTFIVLTLLSLAIQIAEFCYTYGSN
jgi:hypothetical protein